MSGQFDQRLRSYVPSVRWALISVLTAVFLGLPGTCSAQNTASINGTIKDVSGGVVPQATVALKNVETGVERTTVSNDVGVYVLQEILPGKYTIEVRKEGFTTTAEQGVTLVVNQTTTYDFTLTVGSSKQTVTVEANVAALQTSTAELGTAITRAEINDLPLNGRNFSELLTLTPGVSPVNVSQNVGGPRTNAWGVFVVPAVNGQNNRSNMFLLDGVNDNEATFNSFMITPTLDDIQEFKVDSHNDQPQFGGALGGVVNVVTKSGTNAVHGAGWEFLRNSGLDARNPFFTTVNPLRQNQFGANIGGPVVLPHYDGRNRTFFFASYEGGRQHAASQALYLVPTPQEIQGNLSDLGVPIYDPFSTQPDPNNPGEFLRTPFQNGVIPSNELDPHMVAYAQAVYPAPIATGVAGTNGVDNTPSIHDFDQYSLRADEQLNSSNSFFFRFTRDNAPVSGSGGLAGLLSTNVFTGYQAVGGWQHTLGTNSMLQMRFNRLMGTISPNTYWVKSDPTQIISAAGFSKDFACGFVGPKNCLLPGMGITGYASAGENSGGPNSSSDIYEWKVEFSKVHGRHTFNMGADFNTDNLGPDVAAQPSVGFDAIETSSLEPVLDAQGNPIATGSALASFLLGVPDNATRRDVSISVVGGWVNGFYFGDQWKANDRLTVNWGVRYDYTLIPFFPAAQGQNKVGNLDLNNGTYELQSEPPSCAVAGTAPCIPGGVLPANVVVSPNGKIFHNTYDNIQPRLGLAYRLSSKTALRAAYGRFYDNWAAVTQTAQNYQGTWPSVSSTLAQNLNPGLPTVTAENPFSTTPGNLPGPTPFNQVAWYTDPNIKNSYSDQWNFGVQYQVASDTVMTANYAGSHSSRIDVGTYRNTAVTPGPGDAATLASRQPYPYITPSFYDASIGRASYNSFQFSLRRSTSHGLAYLISYTWSKSLDIGCSGWYGAEGCSIENPYNLNNEKGVSAFDLTHMLTASWVYELPIGHGKRFSTGNRAADYALGNWKINGILTMTSGLPYDVGISGDIANTGMAGAGAYDYERLNLVGNPHDFTLSTENGLNRAAFARPANYTYGNLGRDSLRADPFKNLDLSLFREFPFAETKRIEFRADMFNFTNTPTWGIPVQDLNNPDFGSILSTQSTERQVQLSLKFYF
jgi:outer membrane receptor protein involved in Fe transport